MATKKVVLERINQVLWQNQVLDEEGNVIQSGLTTGTEDAALAHGEALAKAFDAELEIKRIGAGNENT